MKNYFILLVISISCFSCNKLEKKESRNISLGDTITTASGLKYIFLKEGSGNPAQVNSKVQAYMDLYLNESDTIFWSKATEKDSIIGFIHGKTSMIKGFEELINYLVEGDEVIAILPDSIAYGRKGGNGMPPATSLVYNPLILKQVSEPKNSVNDTLQYITATKGSAAAINFYKTLITSQLKDKYHTDMEFIFILLDSLTDKKLYPETQDLSIYFSEITKDDSELQTLAYYQMLALEEQGKITEAIAVVEEQLKRESDLEWWEEKKQNLKKKSDSILAN